MKLSQSLRLPKSIIDPDYIYSGNVAQIKMKPTAIEKTAQILTTLGFNFSDQKIAYFACHFRGTKYNTPDDATIKIPTKRKTLGNLEYFGKATSAMPPIARNVNSR